MVELFWDARGRGAEVRGDLVEAGAAGAAAKIDLGGPEDDAARVTRASVACQAGEARADAAALSLVAASPQTLATGQPEVIAILMRRTLRCTRAPILRNASRRVPHVASEYFVWHNPIRRKPQSRTYAMDANHSRS
jgi:hypothetical protein